MVASKKLNCGSRALSWRQVVFDMCVPMCVGCHTARWWCMFWWLLCLCQQQRTTPIVQVLGVYMYVGLCWVLLYKVVACLV